MSILTATMTTSSPLLRNTKSFSRMDSPSPSRTRSSSLLSLTSTANDSPIIPFPSMSFSGEEPDIFENEQENEDETKNGSIITPQSFDDLPIEIKSFTERFVDSLSAPIHPTPLSITNLSDLFQDFYRKADAHVNTHILSLQSKLAREKPVRKSSATKNDSPELEQQQMLTANQLNKRKLARKSLERKRSDLEEAVEKAVCERFYLKLWHHKSTDDEQLDQKLRSRIAALNLIGVGLKELLVSGTEDVSDSMRLKTMEQEDMIRNSLQPARQSLASMSDETYPLGKLHHLAAAHKAIVDSLSTFFPSSSSADEVLPTLIYTLITSSPEAVNVVSDLHFIQRFRAQNKITGEIAYCLVNLEAAIAFLETADLNTLRAEELMKAPVPLRGHDMTPMELGIRAASPPIANIDSFQSLDAGARTPPKAQSRSPRRLSELITAQTTRLEQASDSIRSTVIDGAEGAVGVLENSLRFVFSRVRTTASTAVTTTAPAPKTLEDARKLVATPPLTAEALEGDDLPSNGQTSPVQPETNRARSESDVRQPARSVLDLVGGRRLRDGSVDSSKSGGSNKRVSFAQSISEDNLKGLGLAIPEGNSTSGLPTVGADGTVNPAIAAPTAPAAAPVSGLQAPLAAAASGVESVRNMASQLNPLNSFAKMSLFGRSAAITPPPVAAAGPTSAPSSAATDADSKPLPATPTSASGPSPAEQKVLTLVEDVKKAEVKVTRKFVDCRDAKELRLGEIEELLAEYKKLALVLNKLTG